MKKHLYFVLIVFTYLLSTKLTAQTQITVAGAGTTAINGNYTLAGTSNSRPYFTKGIYRIEYRDGGFGLEWEIWDTVEPNSNLEVKYYNTSTGNTPIVTGWQVDIGAVPAPALTNMVLFTGGSTFTPSAPVPGTNNNPIARFQLDPGADGSNLSALTVSLTGTYSGISNVKLWSSSDATFNSGSDVQLNSKTVAASVTFNSFSSAISSAGTYYFITADLTAGASGTITPVIPSQASMTISSGSISNNFTNASLSNSASTLPVELTDFTASAEDSKVMLTWKTATEQNNYGFEIERSSNQKWEKIGFVNGHGSSSSVRKYSFIDDSPLAGQSSYRLKQIDNDGTFKYYDAITISVEAPKEYKLLQNSPNPFNPVTAIKFHLPAVSKVTLKIYDMTGREVTTLIDEEKPAGAYITYWNGKDNTGKVVSSGIYLYRLTAGNYSEVRKMNFMK